jgi:hypothetical protein
MSLCAAVYRAFTHETWWRGPRVSQVHLITVPRNAYTREIIVPKGGFPGAATPSEMAAAAGVEALVNLSAARRGHPIGHTLVGGKCYGSATAGWWTLDLDRLRLYHPKISLERMRADGVAAAAGVAPVLVSGGSPTGDRPPARTGTRDGPQPRTALGWNDDDLMVAVVDGHQPGYSFGVTLEQLARLMAGLGALTVVNLGGGPDSQLWLESRLVSRPSAAREEPIVTALGMRPV